ncbi:hypothetical protein GCM10010295_14060 [Streptomyces intermedius]
MRREEGEPFGEAGTGREADGDLGVGQHHHNLVTRLPAQHGEEFEYGVLGSDAHQDIDHGQSCLSRAPTGGRTTGRRERDALRRSPAHRTRPITVAVERPRVGMLSGLIRTRARPPGLLGG